jgi:hypothetical protein
MAILYIEHAPWKDWTHERASFRRTGGYNKAQETHIFLQTLLGHVHYCSRDMPLKGAAGSSVLGQPSPIIPEHVPAEPLMASPQEFPTCMLPGQKHGDNLHLALRVQEASLLPPTSPHPYLQVQAILFHHVL